MMIEQCLKMFDNYKNNLKDCFSDATIRANMGKDNFLEYMKPIIDVYVRMHIYDNFRKMSSGELLSRSLRFSLTIETDIQNMKKHCRDDYLRFTYGKTLVPILDESEWRTKNFIGATDFSPEYMQYRYDEYTKKENIEDLNITKKCLIIEKELDKHFVRANFRRVKNCTACVYDVDVYAT